MRPSTLTDVSCTSRSRSVVRVPRSHNRDLTTEISQFEREARRRRTSLCPHPLSLCSPIKGAAPDLRRGSRIRILCPAHALSGLWKHPAIAESPLPSACDQLPSGRRATSPAALSGASPRRHSVPTNDVAQYVTSARALLV